MKTWIGMWAALMCGFSPAWSHMAPVPDNHLELTADPGRVTIRFHADAAWWVLNVLDDQAPPPNAWSSEVQTAVKTYFDRHFILQADGTVLPSRFLSYRYSEEVWHYNGGSQIALELLYDLPPSATKLTGAATFYKEGTLHSDFDTPASITPPAPKTYLSIAGHPRSLVILTLDHDQFSFPIAEILRRPAQRRVAGIAAGLRFWQTDVWLLFLLGMVQLQLRVRFSRATRWTLLAVVALAGAWSLGQLKTAVPGYRAGVFLSLFISAVFIETILAIYYRRLFKLSATQASALFTSQLRFISVLLGGIATLLIAQTFGART